MVRDYLKGDSKALGRPMEALWFGHSGRPVLMFPTSMGQFYELEDFGLIGALAGKFEAGEIQAVCVETIDQESWYNRGLHPAARARRHEQYDNYLRHELLPYIQERSGRRDLAVYGASFGAYHAANFACRYPEAVAKAITFSGIYDIHRYLDGYWDDCCYFHCPTAYVPNMDEAIARRFQHSQFIVATGEHDSLVSENRSFAAMLGGKGIPVHSEIWSGEFGHDWPWWKHHLARFLP
jgi:esterase/lipase superfamily enzyme